MTDLRARVLAALAKFQGKPVEIPELGGTIYVRPLTVAGMARLHGAIADQQIRHDKAADAAKKSPDDLALREAADLARRDLIAAKERSSAMMLMDCVTDEQGRRLFHDGDEALVANMPGAVADKLLHAIEDIGGATADDPKDAAGN